MHMDRIWQWAWNRHRQRYTWALSAVMFAVFLPPATVTLVLLGATRGYGSVVPFVGVEQIGKPVLRVVAALPVVLLAPSVFALSAAWLAPTLLGASAAWLALRRARASHPGAGGSPPAGPGEFWAFAGPRALSSIFDIASLALLSHSIASISCEYIFSGSVSSN